MFAARDFICLAATVSFWILSAEDKTVFELRQILVRGHANKNPERDTAVTKHRLSCCKGKVVKNKQVIELRRYYFL
jgi:hypothetical protein